VPDNPSPAATTARRIPPWYVLLGRALRQPKIILGGVAPALLYYIVQGMTDGITAALIAGGWSLVVIAVGYARTRQVNFFAALAAVVLSVGLITTLIANDPNYYLARYPVGSALSGLIFLGSLLLPRPLVQLLAEESTDSALFPAWMQAHPLYRRIWVRLTVIWGIAGLVQAALLLVLQFTMPLEAFLTAATLLSWSDFVLMAFSFWYPQQVWRRNWHAVQPPEAP
jgi:intracellular septation protein A